MVAQTLCKARAMPEDQTSKPLPVVYVHPIRMNYWLFQGRKIPKQSTCHQLPSGFS